MAIVATDWTVTRTNGNIRYIGDDHNGSSPSYATVIEFHRWLQDLADDAVASGDDELDITNLDPSARSTDNIVTLKNGYNIDDTAAEHIFDGSIIQNDGDDIYDGIVNYGNADVQIQIIQNGSVLADDWWNYDGGGLNPDADQGISHRFMIKTRTAGVDVDGRRLIGTARRFGFTYQEFRINGTSRGNNVLALADGTDLNNQTLISTVAGWTGITNKKQGYIGLDVNQDGSNEFFYSEWDRDTFSINQLYERAKWLTRDGSASTLYGLSGELFRGITHEVVLTTPRSGTFVEPERLTWGTGATAGVGQLLAINSTTTGTKMWIQLLSGAVPSGLITGNGGATTTVSSVTDRSALLTRPFIGASTGTSIIGGYGVGIEVTDITNFDILFDLDNTAYSPPTLVTNTVAGLVATEDRVLVAPWNGVATDSEGNPAIQKNQLSLNTSLTTDNITSVVVTTPIPADTPTTGHIRVTDNNGFERRLHYSSWTGSTFTISGGDYGDGNEDFGTVNATAGNNVYIAYIDVLAGASTASFQSTYASDRGLVVIVRDGGVTPIKQFISAWSITNVSKSISVIRTTDA
jgi:hypothetical protein